MQPPIQYLIIFKSQLFSFCAFNIYLLSGGRNIAIMMTLAFLNDIFNAYEMYDMLNIPDNKYVLTPCSLITNY